MRYINHLLTTYGGDPAARALLAGVERAAGEQMIKPMTTPLRVLIIEDAEDDAELLLELRRGGYAPEYERVETPDGLEDALARQS